MDYTNIQSEICIRIIVIVLFFANNSNSTRSNNRKEVGDQVSKSRHNKCQLKLVLINHTCFIILLWTFFSYLPIASISYWLLLLLDMILPQKIAISDTLNCYLSSRRERVCGLDVYFERHLQSPRIGDSIRFPFLVSPALPTCTQTNRKWSGDDNCILILPHTPLRMLKQWVPNWSNSCFARTIIVCSYPSPKILPWCIQTWTLDHSSCTLSKHAAHTCSFQA
jgi:hypothetical protein